MADNRGPPFGPPGPALDAWYRRTPEEIQAERDEKDYRAWRSLSSVGATNHEISALGLKPGGATAKQSRAASPKKQAEPLPKVGPGARLVLDLIARAERTTPEFARRHGFASDYDVPFNYGRSAPPPDKPISQMNLEELSRYQETMRSGGSTAVGRYQF